MNITNIDDVLSSFPALRGDAETTDADVLTDLKLWACDARALLEQARVVIAERNVAVEQVTEARLTLNGVQQANAALVSASEATSAQLMEASRERDQLRRMHEGVSEDLHRERLANQEAAGDTIQRVLKLTEERDWLRASRDADCAAHKANLASLTTLCNAAQHDRDELAKDKAFVAGQHREALAERDAALRDVAFFKESAENAGAHARELVAEVSELIRKNDDLSVRYNHTADELQALTERHNNTLTEAEHKNSKAERAGVRLASKAKAANKPATKKPARAKPKARKRS